MNNLTTMPVSAGTAGLWFAFLKSAAMLLIVLGAVIGFLFLIRYLINNRQKNSAHGLITLLASHYLSPKERIVLFDIMGEKIVLGVSSGKITALTKIDFDMNINQNDDEVINRSFPDVLNLVTGKKH